jgi:hypothetical protein
VAPASDPDVRRYRIRLPPCRWRRHLRRALCSACGQISAGAAVIFLRSNSRAARVIFLRSDFCGALVRFLRIFEAVYRADAITTWNARIESAAFAAADINGDGYADLLLSGVDSPQPGTKASGTFSTVKVSIWKRSYVGSNGVSPRRMLASVSSSRSREP